MSGAETPLDRVCGHLVEYLADDVDCNVLAEDPSRIGCSTPLEYPDGDAVVVWVRPIGGLEEVLEVSDFGESVSSLPGLSQREQRVSNRIAAEVAGFHGAKYFDGRLSVQSSYDSLGEQIWRVASAAAQIAQRLEVRSPKVRLETEESEFVKTVARTLRTRNIPVEAEQRLAGDSGHKHRATLYVPPSHSVLEPITGHWNQASFTYVKFGDLSRANGYRLFALLDDRHGAPAEEVANLLVQVSSVVRWSAHEQWVGSLL